VVVTVSGARYRLVNSIPAALNLRDFPSQWSDTVRTASCLRGDTITIRRYVVDYVNIELVDGVAIPDRSKFAAPCGKV
jgi:hypothetical protein